MASTTPRLGLYMPADDGSEPVDVAIDLNDNLEKLDAVVGFTPSTSATPPTATFDGMSTYETDTGRAKFRKGGVWNYLLSAGSSFLSHLSLDSAYRFAIGTLTPTALIDLIVSNITSVPVLRARQASEANPRLEITHDSVKFGSGVATADTSITRTGAATLSVAGSVNMQNSLTVNGSASAASMNIAGDLNVDGNIIGDMNVTGSFTGTGLFVPRVIRKTADTSRSSTTVVTADPELTFAVEANSIYYVELFVLYGGDTAADFRSNWVHPTGTSGLRWVIGQGIGATSRDEATVRIGAYGLTSELSFGATTTGNFNGLQERLYFTTDIAGTLSYRWSQSASNAIATTVKAGSMIVVKKLA